MNSPSLRRMSRLPPCSSARTVKATSVGVIARMRSLPIAVRCVYRLRYSSTCAGPPNGVLAYTTQSWRYSARWRARQAGVAGVSPLAAGHAHAHAVAVAVDVAHPQDADFGDAQPSGVDGLQQHAPHGVRAHRQQARDLFAREQLGLSGRYFGKRDVKLLSPVAPRVRSRPPSRVGSARGHRFRCGLQRRSAFRAPQRLLDSNRLTPGRRRLPPKWAAPSLDTTRATGPVSIPSRLPSRSQPLRARHRPILYLRW